MYSWSHGVPRDNCQLQQSCVWWIVWRIAFDVQLFGIRVISHRRALRTIAERWTLSYRERTIWPELWMAVQDVYCRERDFLYKIGYVHWHLLNLSVVKLFNIMQDSLLLAGDEVDGHAFATETTTATDSATETIWQTMTWRLTLQEMGNHKQTSFRSRVMTTSRTLIRRPSLSRYNGLFMDRLVKPIITGS